MGLSTAHADTVIGLAIDDPDPMYLALLKDMPAPTMTGSTINEANYAGYARVSVAASAWTAPSEGQVTLAAPASFPALSSGSARVRAFALLSAATAGSLLWYGEIPELVFYSTDPEPPTLSSLVVGITRAY